MNVSRLLLSIILANALLSAAAQTNDTTLKLWYDKPATIWEEALPLGNGKMGAMVFGGVGTERYQLNDNTLWSGSPVAGNQPEGPKILQQVRKQIFAGNWDSATVLWKKMHGPYSARYLTMADLWLKIPGADTLPANYYRDLNLNDAITTVKYTLNGTNYVRESFISYPDKIMVIRITADKKGAVNVHTAITSKLKYQVKAVENNFLVLKGKAPKHVPHRDDEPRQIEYDDWNGEGTNFEIHVKVIPQNGNVKQSGEQLAVTGADAVTIYVSAATSFNGFNKSPGLNGKNAAAEASGHLRKAANQSHAQLKEKHRRDYQSLFKRVHLDLGASANVMHLPTNERLKRFTGDPTDNHLVTLFYQFGRYLMIGGSRPGSRPTNLQGIWNDHVQPPWGSNYTTNINTEMNYWPAEHTNLSECHEPLFDFMKELSVNGAVTAKTNYNISPGWVTHHNSDIWAKTSPSGGFGWNDPRAMPRWSAWPMAGAWFSTHLWEHYLFTGDKKFLREKAYPLMKGAADFMLQWLVEDPETGYLVTNPSTSPENTIKIAGREYQLSMASTMDMSIIRELFTALVNTTQALNLYPEYRQTLERALEKLYPYHIGQYGQLQEWFKDWDDPKDQHRHLSHLYGLYPGSQISAYRTPELAAAAKQSLIQRGDVSTGWSMGWKINWWARLQDPEHAHKILSLAFNYINPAEARETMGGGGTYPNLFDAHPPFQIDGNFGATAGITEMLLQSHDGEISLLPALPSAWRNGEIKGIKARGNFAVDMKWNEGKLTVGKIHSIIGGDCRIRTAYPVKVLEVSATPATGATANPLLTHYPHTLYKKNPSAKLVALDVKKGYVIDFKTEKGKTYTLVPI